MADLTVLSLGTGDAELDKALAIAGYAYDASQDIFVSTMDPWQRSIGYCRLYDEAAAPMGMIIDCEPIYFSYNNKKWMIGLWKGQYDLVTGAEIGIYSNGVDVELPMVFKGTYYQAASDNECLQMGFTLKKGDRILFTREDRHWWLTGFRLGEFSEPSELTMEGHITFESSAMRDAFLAGMKQAGYSKKDYRTLHDTVYFDFSSPRSAQPLTRTPTTDYLIQRKTNFSVKVIRISPDPIRPFRKRFKSSRKSCLTCIA